ncbi:MAG: branched-chain amino acid ABC transporter ATP-binding protein/permease [Firmicutes bacterium]|nr:branched-chain amino acid ABC transporter ATP-binding protein/permease [Bacillota bacterium]
MRKKLQSYGLNILALALLYGLMSFLIGQGAINKYYLGILLSAGIAIIMAVSLNLTIGLLGELALGHAGFMGVGAYAAALFTKNIGMDPATVFPLTLLLGGLAAAVFGLIIGIPALRLKGDYLAIITLGFGEIIRVLIINLDFTGGARGMRGIPRITNFTYVYVLVALVVAVMFTLGRSRHGRAILSIREDPVAAEASGIPTTYYRIFAFTVAAFFAGVAGGLYAHYVGVLDPNNFGFMKSIEYLVMVVLGGMGSITGAISAALVLTALPELLRQFSEYRMLVYSLLLIGMMLFRPAGLLGIREFSLTGLLSYVFRRCPHAEPEEREMPQAVAQEAPPLRPPVAEDAPVLLSAQRLGIQFGGLKALTDFDVTIHAGEIVGLIGPNGAGKTTVFNLLTNVYLPTSGVIEVEGVNVVGVPTHEITQVGIARTFQNIRLFRKLTVLDNVKIAYHNQMQYTSLEGTLRLPRYWSEEARANARAYQLLRVFGLEKLAEERADSLPYGAQRKLEIARALATNPKLLLLDEPAAGMNPIETQDLMATIRNICDRFNVAILLIEHDMSLVMGICERIVVLDYGQMIALGTPDEIRRDPKVIGAYLGGE